MNQGRITVSLHDHLVVTKLLGNITCTGARYLNPCLGKESTGSQDEHEVEYRMEGIVNNLRKTSGWGNVVCNSSHGDGGSTTLGILPLSEQTDEDIGGGTVVQQLTDKVKVGYQGSLEDDGHVTGIKQFNGVCSSLTTVLLVLDGKIHTPSLEVNDNDKDQHSGQEIGQVGKILTVQCLLEGTKLVTSGNHEMEEGNNSSFKLSTTSSIEGSG
mmetsp:Transcript_22397/g.33091  ORF Transcript_22397/g.33091 Transcript_22397/m.33091 type:complete len:213 (+) Transcript_22397:683-1321(+)